MLAAESGIIIIDHHRHTEIIGKRQSDHLDTFRLI